MSGRGAYYKAKYGGGGRGGGRGFAPNPMSEEYKRPRFEPTYGSGSPQDSDRLRQMLLERDNRPYPAYQDIKGSWLFPGFKVTISRTQSDPFAPPTRFKLDLSQAQHKWPQELYSSSTRRVALADWLTRRFVKLLKPPSGPGSSPTGRNWHSSKGGDFMIDRPGEQVLERSSCRFHPSTGDMVVRMSMNLPARGRSIMGELAAKLFCDQLVDLVNRALVWTHQLDREAKDWVEAIEDQESLRQQVTEADLVAFVGNGSILPRQSGASELPMSSSEPGLVPFQSPPSLQREFNLPNRGIVAGMAIPKGITLIVGGGFHGKSTLLEAISNGISNYTPTSGLSLVVTPKLTVPVSSEDGRPVTACNISPFIRNLPNKKNTDCFSTSDASGSTSMAASCVEALELFDGRPGTLLLDEDGCAVNFLIRDEKMSLLVPKKSEPITPYIFKSGMLSREHNVSTVMVVGGCGDYCHVADYCIKMENYKAYDLTSHMKEVAASFDFKLESESGPGFKPLIKREVLASSLLPPYSQPNISAKSTYTIQHGPDATNPDQLLNLIGLVQLSSLSQTRSLAAFLAYLGSNYGSERLDLRRIMRIYEEVWNNDESLEKLSDAGRVDVGGMAKVNTLMIGMAVNRLRCAKFNQIR